MTKENFTSINVIIDKSGSMDSLTNDTIGGFNTFLADQKQVPGEAIMTLCLFDTSYRLVYDCKPLADVPPLNSTVYIPSGGTALLDAVGMTIDKVGQKLAAMEEHERPSKVLFLIITDGEENSSKEYALAKVHEMVSHQREKYSWEFVFMGANIDSVSVGASIGVATANAVNYSASSIGTKNLYANISNSTRQYRSAGTPAQVDFFNQDDQNIIIGVPSPVIEPASGGDNK